MNNLEIKNKLISINKQINTVISEIPMKTGDQSTLNTKLQEIIEEISILSNRI